MQQIIEMLKILTELSLDRYMMFKYAIMSKRHDYESEYFFTKLFEVAEKRRPKLLEMKGGAVNA